MSPAPKPQPSRDAHRISDRRLVGPALSFLVHVPTFLGGRWVDRNRSAIVAAGADPKSVERAFQSGFTGSAMLLELGVPEDDLEAEVLASCIAWLRECRKTDPRYGAVPGFDVFFASDREQNGDAALVVSMAPPPPPGWQARFQRRLSVNTTSTSPVVLHGGRPVLHVVKGDVAFGWTESVAFRRRAAALMRKALRRAGVAPGPGDRAENPYATPRPEYEARQLRERRAVRRAAVEEMRPLLERIGILIPRDERACANCRHMRSMVGIGQGWKCARPENRTPEGHWLPIRSKRHTCPLFEAR